MGLFKAYIHSFNIEILIDAHSIQNNEPGQCKTDLFEILGMI